MSKITVITDAKNQIQAVGHGHLSEATNRKKGGAAFQGGMRPVSGQKIHELDVPHDLTQIKGWKELVETIRPHVKAS